MWARAAGNPFFAEQLVLHHGVDLPATVNELLVGRLVDLPRATRRLLTAAAVAGGALEPDVLGAVLDVDGARLTEMLEPAVEAHVLVPDDGRLAFGHALLAEVAERMLLPTEAVGLHEAIADALASGRGSHAAAERTSALARHRIAAGDPRRALPASLAAARQAVAVLAHPEAHRHYEDVLALWDRVDDASAVVGTDRATMLREAAEVAHLAGRFRRAAELAREALDLLDADADPKATGLVCERLGRYLWMAGDGTAAHSSYERAMDLVPATTSRTRTRVLSGQSQALVVAGDFARGLELAERAVAMAREVGARDVEGHALNNRGVARSHLGELDAGLADLDEAAHIAEQLGDDVDAVLRAIVNRTTALLDAGLLREAAAFGLERRKGVWSRCETAAALLELGRLDRADQLVAEAREYRPGGIEAAVVLAVDGRLQRLRGRLDRAEDLLEAAADAARDAVDGHLLGRVGTEQVRLCLDRGQPEAGLDRAGQAWSRLPHLAAAHAAPLAAAAVEAGVDAGLGGSGGPRDAERWHRRCAAVVRGSPGASPVAWAWLATAGAEHGRLDSRDAVAWGPVVEAWDRLGAGPEAARSRWRRAGAILDRGGDRAEAAGLLRVAHQAASEMGLDGLGSRVLDLARRARIEVAHAGDVEPEGVLTPREHDVLELVTEGHTNREIADRLFIGHRTVATHVSNILAKLGASTRSGAAAIALREGHVD